MASPSRLLRKLRGRSTREIYDRLAQSGSALLERAGLLDAAEPDATSLRQALRRDLRSRPSALAELHQRICTGTAPAFFAGCDDRDATLAALRSCEPGAEARVLSRADRMLAGRFDVLGLEGVEFGSPIDWHLEPQARVRSPRVHWSRIRYLDPAVAGDHKVVWEVNRHHALVTMAQAWWYTGDERYARTALSWWTQWMDANPPKTGINWASSLEVAFRSIAWTWTLRLLRSWDGLTEGHVTRALGFLHLGGRHLARYLSTWFSPNTHLTGEALGLFYIGSQFPELESAERWSAMGAGIILSELPRHVGPDGVYCEQSSYYHRYTVDILTHLLVLGERTGAPLRASVGPPLERLLEHLLAITRADGSMPLIGDDDGGRLLFLDGRPATDTRSALATGAALFGRGDLAYVAGEAGAEAVWLLGPGAGETLASLQRAAPSFASIAFPSGGIYVMRNRWQPDGDLLVVDAGPHGFLNAGHAHADALSFDLAIGGRPALVDPGTFTYTTSPEWRDHFRGTAAHNAVTVDGADSSEMAGPFTWRRVAETRVKLWSATPVADLFVAMHDGFEQDRAGASYERTILGMKSGYWLFRDRVTAPGRHEAAVCFQCAPGLAAAAHGTALVVRDASNPFFQMTSCGGTGTWSIEEGWVSPAYARRVSAPHCMLHLPFDGAVEGVVLVAPAEVDDIAVSQGVITLACGGRRDLIALGPRIIAESTPGVETDARVLVVSRDADSGAAIEWFAHDASHLRIDGQDVLGAERGGTLAGRRTGSGAWQVTRGADRAAPVMER